MLAGDRIKWANCATGFLWRTWYSCTFSRGGLLPSVAVLLERRDPESMSEVADFKHRRRVTGVTALLQPNTVK